MSRLIDAENLDFVSYQGVPDGYDDSFDSGVLYAMNLIDEQPTIDAIPVWIPCSERSPEEDGQYLITVKYKHVNDSYEDVYAEHGEWFDGKWDMFSFGHCGEVEDIIAWMPLPQPYKMDEVTE